MKPTDKLLNYTERILDMNEIQYAMQDLLSAGFEVLLLNPGIAKQEWTERLYFSYCPEWIDAFGVDEESIDGIAELWDTEYYDHLTDQSHTFAKWSQILCNQQEVDKYYASLNLPRYGN